jgi:hypothetical protein
LIVGVVCTIDLEMVKPLYTFIVVFGAPLCNQAFLVTCLSFRFECIVSLAVDAPCKASVGVEKRVKMWVSDF